MTEDKKLKPTLLNPEQIAKLFENVKKNEQEITPVHTDLADLSGGSSPVWSTSSTNQDTRVMEIEYPAGDYPTNVADSSISEELEKEFRRGHLKKAGTLFSIVNSPSDSHHEIKPEDYPVEIVDPEIANNPSIGEKSEKKAETVNFKSEEYPEFDYDGKRYVRVVATGNSGWLSTGEKVQKGKAYWINVEPISGNEKVKDEKASDATFRGPLLKDFLEDISRVTSSEQSQQTQTEQVDGNGGNAFKSTLSELSLLSRNKEQNDSDAKKTDVKISSAQIAVDQKRQH